jgi:large subunit ribosomal protein L16
MSTSGLLSGSLDGNGGRCGGGHGSRRRVRRRGGKVWVNLFPDKPVTKKPAETRMGSGKGNPEGWVAVVKPGRVMFELSGVGEPLAREAMLRAAHKLPIKSKFITRAGGGLE